MLKKTELESPTMKFFTDEEKKNLTSSLNAKAGDLIFILSGPKLKTLNTMGCVKIRNGKAFKSYKRRFRA